MAESISLILTGFGVVMLVLASLWAICATVGFVFVSQEKRKQAAANNTPPAAAAGAAPSPTKSTGIPPHHMVAIAAAVAQTLGSGYAITRVAAPAHKVMQWPMEGRASIFASHITRHGWGMPANTKIGSATRTTRRG